MADDDLNHKTLLNETLPAVNGPKLAVHVTDAEGFTAWCAERGFTPEQYLQYFTWMMTPEDPWDRLVRDRGNYD